METSTTQSHAESIGDNDSHAELYYSVRSHVADFPPDPGQREQSGRTISISSHGTATPLGGSQSGEFTIRHRNQGLGASAPAVRDPLGNSDQHFRMAENLDYDVIARNEVEAHRMANNSMFGFKKWKSNVTKRPLCERSEVVKQLYDSSDKVEPEESTCTLGNIIYLLLFGWWIALAYVIVGFIMLLTIVGYKYCKYCMQLAAYFLWPFGKFVQKNLSLGVPETSTEIEALPISSRESTPLLDDADTSTESTDVSFSNGGKAVYDRFGHKESRYWFHPGTYVWLLLGLPIITIVHLLAFLISWMFVVTIPIAKVNLKVIQRLSLLPPDLLRIDRSSLNPERGLGDILVYTYQAVNIYYYKYTLEGVNIIFLNLLMFVPLAIIPGYADMEGKYVSIVVVFIFCIISIIPLSHFIGMGISSISAQSNFAVGALLNVSFGSVVEIIIYLLALQKDSNSRTSSQCYHLLVRGGLVGSILVATLLLPGLAMIVGGMKYATQRFNARSAAVSATLLFVSVAGIFAPSIFARTNSQLNCHSCNSTSDLNSTGLHCHDCYYSLLVDMPNENDAFTKHVQPLIYTCGLMLPIAYIVGLVFTFKTHRSEIMGSTHEDNSHGDPQWGRIKGGIVLLVAVALVAMCADLLTEHIQPIFAGQESLTFLGVTILAIIPDIPDLIIAVQFALNNNITLSIDLGSSAAIQVCMVQIPVLILSEVIHGTGFLLVFDDALMFSALIGVLLYNYILQDGKANYFQGTGLLMTYLFLMAMFLFSPKDPVYNC